MNCSQRGNMVRSECWLSGSNVEDSLGSLWTMRLVNPKYQYTNVSVNINIKYLQ